MDVKRWERRRLPVCVDCKRELKVIMDNDGLEKQAVCLNHGVVWCKKTTISFEKKSQDDGENK